MANDSSRVIHAITLLYDSLHLPWLHRHCLRGLHVCCLLELTPASKISMHMHVRRTQDAFFLFLFLSSNFPSLRRGGGGGEGGWCGQKYRGLFSNCPPKRDFLFRRGPSGGRSPPAARGGAPASGNIRNNGDNSKRGQLETRTIRTEPTVSMYLL